MLAELELSSFAVTGITVLVVMLIDWWLPIPSKYHPVTFFRLVADRLGEKVHPDPKRPPTQQHISGMLAVIALIPCIILIAWLFIPFTEFPWFFEGVLLWLSLGLMPCLTELKKVQVALVKQRKVLARDRLDDWVLRKTHALTPVGIAKASCEALALRNVYFYQAIIIYFVLLGPYVALTLRLLLELYHAWNPKKQNFIHFGQPARWLCHILLFVPARLSALTYMVAGGGVGMIKAIKQARGHWHHSNSLWPLAAVGSALKAKLGGPVIYDDDKLRRAHLGQLSQPDPNTLAKTRRLVMFANLVMVLILILIVAVSMVT